MKKEKTRRLAAIMFTDIVGYTALMQKDENAAADKRAHHREEFELYHKKYNGEILQYFGDGTLSVFQSGVEAVECAIEIQKALKKGEVVPLRVGLHMGDIVFDGTDIYGDGVNLASRIESMGVAGGILISGTLNNELKNQQQILTHSLGYFELKNIVDPVEVFTVTNEGVKVPIRSELKGKQKETSKTIAVLPFVNMSSNADNEYFSDGMTEEIINALAKIKELKVTSRTSSFFFKNKNIPISQIGQELNVSTILEGSIRLSGNMMRITAQLINVAEDFHFWSETFDRSIENIFAVQDEISLLIADRLREHIGHFELEDHLVDAQDISVETYKRYLKSRFHILKMTKKEIEKGMSILEDIILEEPKFALAHLGMHLVYTLKGMMGLIPAEEGFMKGKPFLDKAILLNEDLPECQLHLSYDAFLQKWDLKTAYRHLNKSFEIRPSVEFYQSMSSTLVAERKFEAAQNYIDTALQLDPFSEINHHLKGFVFYAQEQYEKAITWFGKAIELKPSFAPSSFYFGQTLLLMGKGEEGLAFFQKMPEDDAGDLTKLGFVTLAHSVNGNTIEAKAGIEKLEAALETDMMSRAITALTLCHAMLGNEEKAIKLLEQAVEFRLPMMIYLFVEPLYKSLHSNPSFQKLVRQIIGEVTEFGLSKKKYKKSSLKTEDAEKYYLRLEEYMLDEKPFLQSSLTLRDLAKMIDIHPNYLSELLNEKIGKNFSAFINFYRVETFKKIAQDPKNAHLSLLGLAYESGFNSKTAFNTFFKKETGMTPNQYLKSVS